MGIYSTLYAIKSLLTQLKENKSQEDMQNLLEELKTTLQNDERLIIDGQLVKNKVVELALAMDEGLIALLYKQ